MRLSPGEKLGPYEIVAPIGKGGMGEVYRARDPRLNRDVAINIPNAQFTERFAREARTIAALNHTNICHLYHVGQGLLHGCKVDSHATVNVVLCVTPFTMAMSAEPVVSFNMAPIPGVSMTSPTSCQFAGAIQSLVDPAVLSAIQPVLPFCYVLTNRSDQVIIVYSTRWMLTDASGNVTTEDRTWWNLSTLRDGDAIGPGTSRLVSPIFRLGVNRVGPTGAQLSREVQRTLSALGTREKVTASLETVIFEDGTTVGTDATNATVQAQAYLDAERQVSDLILRAASAGDDIKQLLSRLAPAPAGPRTYRLSNPPQYEESLALRRQTLSSALLRLIQSNASWADQLNSFHQNVAGKRSLNIVRQ